MRLKHTFLLSTMLSGTVLATASGAGYAASIVVDNGVTYNVVGTEIVGTVFVGQDNAGQVLNVPSSTTLNSNDAAIGVNPDSDNNTVNVKGSWNNTTTLNIGYEGSGNTLNVQEGGDVVTGALWMGGFSDSTGNKLTINGSDSTVTTSAAGSATTTVAIGYGSNNNTVTVENNGSLTTLSNGNLDVGFNGDGNKLNILSGGDVISGDDMRIGLNEGSDNNAVKVSGAGSTLTVNSSKTLYVGLNGNGNSLLVEKDADIYTRNARIGGGSGSTQDVSNNYATVTGDGSTWTLSGSLRIGEGGVKLSSQKHADDNSLNVLAGGKVTLTTNANTFIGFNADDDGNSLIVSGVGAVSGDSSSYSTNGDIWVGANATLVNFVPVFYSTGKNGLLAAENGGSISAAENIYVGDTNTVRVGESATLTAKNLTMLHGATLETVIDDQSPASLSFSGTATLDGFYYADTDAIDFPQQRYTILEAVAVVGTFDDYEVSYVPDHFLASLDYTSTEVDLLFTANLGGADGLNDNQQNVAGAIDGYFNDGGTLSDAFQSLYDLDGNALAQTMTELSGEIGATGGVNAVEQATNAFLRLLGGGHAAGPQAPAAQMAAAELRDGAIMPTADVPETVAAGWSMWGGIYGGVANLPGDDDKGSHDTDTNVFGVAAGFDYAMSPETVVGFAIGGGKTNWDLDSGLGSGDSTFVQLGAYGTQHIGEGYVSLAGAYAWHSMSTERDIDVDGSESLDADFNAGNLSGRIEAGYRLAPGADFGFTPYGAFQAQAVYMPDYEESGSSEFALAYDSSTDTALRSELGLRFDTALGMSAEAAKLYGRLAWAHDWDSDAEVQVSFQSLTGSSFTVNGAAAPDDVALVSAGAEFGLGSSTRLSAAFDGEFGQDYQSYAGSLALNVSW